MNKTNFALKYTAGLTGMMKLPFEKFVAFLEWIAGRGGGADEDITADDAGESVIGNGSSWVNITAGTDANAIVHLPAVADIEVGHVVEGAIGATGCEIRVHADDSGTVYLNNVNTAAVEAALAANASFKARYVAANRWVLHNFAAAGTVTAPVPD